MATTPIPNWFKNAVADGLTRQYALNLEGCPGADVLEGTIAVWIEDLWARMAPSEPEHTKDQPRMEAAFRSLRLSCRRWPVPATFFEHLRPRQVPRPPALPPGDIGEAERARRVLENARRRSALGLPEHEGQQP